MYMRQLSELESTVSQLRSELREAKRMYEDKVSLDFAAVLPETIVHRINHVVFMYLKMRNRSNHFKVKIIYKMDAK